MKPPYVEITATCSKHGQFQVQRKPNKNPGTAADTGAPAPVYYQTVKCPVCPFYCKIDAQKLIEPNPAPATGQDGFKF